MKNVTWMDNRLDFATPGSGNLLPDTPIKPVSVLGLGKIHIHAI